LSAESKSSELPLFWQATIYADLMLGQQVENSPQFHLFNASLIREQPNFASGCWQVEFTKRNTPYAELGIRVIFSNSG